jgi:allophanate hydrolase subunit 2
MEKINFAITGDVFKIKKKNKLKEIVMKLILEDGDEIDIISTNKSVYGYLAINGQFDIKFQWSSCSINTKQI